MASRYISGEAVTKTRTIWMYAPSRVDGPRGEAHARKRLPTRMAGLNTLHHPRTNAGSREKKRKDMGRRV
jgi:hypothetical protein